MNNSRPGLAGPALAECYETLRHDALGNGDGHALRGRAVLMFKGMAAWIQSVTEMPLPPRTPLVATASRLPAGVEQNLVAIVATMAFATVQEARP